MSAARGLAAAYKAPCPAAQCCRRAALTQTALAIRRDDDNASDMKSWWPILMGCAVQASSPRSLPCKNPLNCLGGAPPPLPPP